MGSTCSKLTCGCCCSSKIDTKPEANGSGANVPVARIHSSSTNAPTATTNAPPSGGTGLPGITANTTPTGTTSPPGNNPTTVARGPSSLWDKAIDKVQSKGKTQTSGTNGYDVKLVQALLNEISEKKKECDEKRWFYINAQGEKIFYVETLVGQLNKYALIGDIALQHHPDIVALAWAGFRMLLQVGTAYTENMRAVSAALNYLVGVLCSSDIYERLYCGRQLEIGPSLEDTLVDLYASILEYLAHAKSYVSKDTTARVLESFLSTLSRLLDSVREKESEVKNKTDIAEKEASSIVRFNQEEKTKELKRLLTHIQDHIEDIKSSVNEMFAMVKRDRRTKILTWLSVVEYKSHHSSRAGLRQRGTGGWLLVNSKFVDWRNSPSSPVFWLRGDAGTGKTILTSFLIDELSKNWERRECVLAYFYCDYTQMDRREPASILRTLVKQFCVKNGTSDLFPKLVEDAYKDREDGGNSSSALDAAESTTLIKKLSRNYLETIIVIDALDECDKKTQRELFSALHSIATESSRVKIFLTSRMDNDVKEIFSGFPNHYIDARDNSSDINEYIKEQIERRCNVANRSLPDKLLLNGNVDQELKEQIISTLQAKANGMFMWAHLQIVSLCEEKTAGGVANALRKLPIGLDATYHRILDRINTQPNSSKLVAWSIIKWLSSVQGRCSTLCAIQALAVHPGDASLDHDALTWSIPNILEVCQNLVVHDERLGTFRFAHFSVQEFLLEHVLPKDHRYIAELCLTALTYHYHNTKAKPTLIPEFLAYCISNWGVHARLSGAGTDTDTFTSLCRDFLQDSPAYGSWASEIRRYDENLSTLGRDTISPFWVACYYQLFDILTRLFQFDTGDLESRNYEGDTPLISAVRHGHKEMVKLLLSKDGMDVNSKSIDNSTSLHLAAKSGQDDVVQLLLAKPGVYVDNRDKSDCTPLYYAATTGGRKVVDLLLRNGGVDVNSFSGFDDMTPLLGAAKTGQVEVAKLLLSHPAVQVNECDVWGRSPVSVAATFGQVGVLGLLQKAQGVDMNSHSLDGSTALHNAADGHRMEVIQLLVCDKRVDAFSFDISGRTPLARTEGRGLKKMVNIYLDNGRASFVSADSWTLLHAVVDCGFEEPLKLVLGRKEVDVNFKDSEGYTPLCRAVMKHNRRMVELLMNDDRVNVNEGIENGLTPLHLALGCGFEDIIQLLLDDDRVNVNAESKSGTTPLYIVAKARQESAMRLFVRDKRVDINRKDSRGWTPLHQAAGFGDLEALGLLFNIVNGADVNCKGKGNSTPLHMAVLSGRIEVVQFLLGIDGVEVSCKDSEGLTPHALAVKRKKMDIASALKEFEKAHKATRH